MLTNFKQVTVLKNYFMQLSVSVAALFNAYQKQSDSSRSFP